MSNRSPTPPNQQPLALVVSVGVDDYLQQLAENASQSLQKSGYRVELLDLAAANYAPAMTEADRRAYHTEQSIVDPLVQTQADLVLAAKVLVFVYPVIWGTMPSLLKGWIDRTFVIGVALILVNGKVKRNLTGVNHVVGIAVSSAPVSPAIKSFADQGKRLITRTIPIITKRRAKKHYWHHTRGSSDADFARQVSAALAKL